MNLLKMFGLGKKGASYDTYTTPPSADYTALIGKLQGIGDTGFPEMQQWGQNYYNQQLLPQIREQYEAKRNPYGGGFADTPEAMQFAKGAQGVTSDVAKANMEARMNALQLLSGLVNKPQQQTTYQAEYNPIQDLLTGGLSLGAKLGSNYLGSKWNAEAMKDVYGSLAKQVQSKDYGSGFFDLASTGMNFIPGLGPAASFGMQALKPFIYNNYEEYR